MAIFFFCPDYDFPSGGVRVIYRHVDVLNSLGVEAYVVHKKRGYRCKWFDNSTPVLYIENGVAWRAYKRLGRFLGRNYAEGVMLYGNSRRKVGVEDIFVVPEILGPNVGKFAPGIPKVILNQGCYLTFRGYPLDRALPTSPYMSKDVVAVLINSDDGLTWLQYAFGGLNVSRFHVSIDPKLFCYKGDKKRQICFSPRKNHGMVRHLIQTLIARDALAGFELVPFSGIDQVAVAKIMQESAIFLNFGQYEGFGLPPAEAMACGCVVIGFHGGGGKEFMRPGLSFPVDYDLKQFAEHVEYVTTRYDGERDYFIEMGRSASQYINEVYSPEREVEDLKNFWGRLGLFK